MKNQYEYTINSTEDINRALAEAGREGYDLTHYNSAFYLRGEEGRPISVDGSLKDLFVTAYGPAPVYASGGTTVIAEGDAVVYAMDGAVVDAYDRATVYAYYDAQVDVSMDASVYVASDDVDVNAWGTSKVYLPPASAGGSDAHVNLKDGARIIRGESPSN